jgi:AcrR family transcriptional regulator
LTDSSLGPESTTSRRRLSRSHRHAQLLDAARELIRAEGTDELALSKVAQRAGVAKPLVYDHFGTRSAVLEELYREFDARQHAALRTALGNAPHQLDAIARIMADAYINCAVAEGQEMADVVAALSGSPTLDRLRQDAEMEYLAQCNEALSPFSSKQSLDQADLRALLGAAIGLARAAIGGQVEADAAQTALARVIAAVTTGS